MLKREAMCRLTEFLSYWMAIVNVTVLLWYFRHKPSLLISISKDSKVMAVPFFLQGRIILFA
jgi:hypothetical protein